MAAPHAVARRMWRSDGAGDTPRERGVWMSARRVFFTQSRATRLSRRAVSLMLSRRAAVWHRTTDLRRLGKVTIVTFLNWLCRRENPYKTRRKVVKDHITSLPI